MILRITIKVDPEFVLRILASVGQDVFNGKKKLTKKFVLEELKYRLKCFGVDGYDCEGRWDRFLDNKQKQLVFEWFQRFFPKLYNEFKLGEQS